MGRTTRVSLAERDWHTTAFYIATLTIAFLVAITFASFFRGILFT